MMREKEKKKIKKNTRFFFLTDQKSFISYVRQEMSINLSPNPVIKASLNLLLEKNV